ncbi:hypothetical protein [Olleya sp. HaHaR_3_96]|uniref:hypothetical protein n=1 Tax=Olleya sp. HaHaR_3_96 TaxID=2745560 RepID=UPI001C4F4D80|nr:hypothetical protein [Olleya sp. HaHaR_3_96]QXP59308.1 hypothetical protein H0I26_15485 [Olleya sp. HaHaR_3_96]
MEEDIISKKALKNHKINLDPTGLYSRYGCMIIFEDNQAKNSLRYKLEIKYLGKSDSNSNIFQINRNTDIYINDKLPESSMDELASKVSQVIYPLELETNKNGTLKSVTNFNEIQDRWSVLKKELKKYYKGETTDSYIKLNDKTLSISELFFNKIKQDWFLHLFFAPVYVSYTDSRYVFDKPKYYIAGNAGLVEYDAKKILEENTSGPIHFVKINGTINDQRCALDLEQELKFPYYKTLNSDEKPLEGTCNVTYGIHKDTGVIQGIEAFFETKFVQPKKITVKMFSLDKLEEIETPEEEKEVENGFWSRFFKKSNK